MSPYSLSRGIVRRAVLVLHLAVSSVSSSSLNGRESHPYIWTSSCGRMRPCTTTRNVCINATKPTVTASHVGFSPVCALRLKRPLFRSVTSHVHIRDWASLRKRKVSNDEPTQRLSLSAIYNLASTRNAYAYAYGEHPLRPVHPLRLLPTSQTSSFAEQKPRPNFSVPWHAGDEIVLKLSLCASSSSDARYRVLCSHVRTDVISYTGP